MIRLVVFDLDGTLINTIADLGVATDYALSLNNLKGHSIEEYTSMVGHGVKKLVECALEKSLGHPADDALVNKTLDAFTKYYVEHIDVFTRPYKGMVELLGKLQEQNIKVAVASNKFQEGAEKLVGKFFPEIDFVSVLGNRVDLPLKPDAKVVNMILEKAGVTKEDCLFVGDSATDVKTALNAGVRCIGVSWGFRSEKELIDTGASSIAHNAEELYSLICASN